MIFAALMSTREEARVLHPGARTVTLGLVTREIIHTVSVTVRSRVSALVGALVLRQG